MEITQARVKCPSCGNRFEIGILSAEDEHRQAPDPEALAISVDDVDWSPQRLRILAAFQANDIKTVADLVRLGGRILLRTPNFGRQSFSIVQAKLAAMGIEYR
jgi:DNA-directed RNA polymerase alpha subunit